MVFVAQQRVLWAADPRRASPATLLPPYGGAPTRPITAIDLHLEVIRAQSVAGSPVVTRRLCMQMDNAIPGLTLDLHARSTSSVTAHTVWPARAAYVVAAVASRHTRTHTRRARTRHKPASGTAVARQSTTASVSPSRRWGSRAASTSSARRRAAPVSADSVSAIVDKATYGRRRAAAVSRVN